MNKFKQFLTEELERRIKTVLVVYPGPFQCATAKHAGIFFWMTGFSDPQGADCKFFIATSDKTEEKSPLTFEQKKFIWTSVFGLKPEQIILTQQPYRPVEITEKYDANSTALILVVGEKDQDRIEGFGEKGIVWQDKMPIEKSLAEATYFLVVPNMEEGVSGTEARQILSQLGDMSKSAKEEALQKVFGKTDINDDVVKMLGLTMMTESYVDYGHDPKNFKSNEIWWYEEGKGFSHTGPWLSKSHPSWGLVCSHSSLEQDGIIDHLPDLFGRIDHKRHLVTVAEIIPNTVSPMLLRFAEQWIESEFPGYQIHEGGKTRNVNESLTLYHGTKEDFQDGDISTNQKMYGIHLTTDPKAAESYGKVKTYTLSSEAKVLDLSEEDLWEWMKQQELLDENDLQNEDLKNYVQDGRIFQYDISSRTHYADDIARTARSLGYDVVRMIDDLGSETDNTAWIVVNPKVLLSKEKNLHEFTYTSFWGSYGGWVDPEKRLMHKVKKMEHMHFIADRLTPEENDKLNSDDSYYQIGYYRFHYVRVYVTNDPTHNIFLTGLKEDIEKLLDWKGTSLVKDFVIIGVSTITGVDPNEKRYVRLKEKYTEFNCEQEHHSLARLKQALGISMQESLHEDIQHDPIASASYPYGSGGGYLVDPANKIFYDMEKYSHQGWLEKNRNIPTNISERDAYLKYAFKKFHYVHMILAHRYENKENTLTVYLTGLKQDIEKLLAWKGSQIVKNFDMVVISYNERFSKGYVEFDTQENLHSLARLKQALGIQMNESTLFNDDPDYFTPSWINPDNKKIYLIDDDNPTHGAIIINEMKRRGMSVSNWTNEEGEFFDVDGSEALYEIGYKFGWVRASLFFGARASFGGNTLNLTGRADKLKQTVEIFGKKIAQYSIILFLPTSTDKTLKAGRPVTIDMDAEHHSVAKLKQALGIKMQEEIQNFLQSLNEAVMKESQPRLPPLTTDNFESFWGTTGGWYDPKNKKVHVVDYSQHRDFIRQNYFTDEQQQEMNLDTSKYYEYAFEKLNFVRVNVGTFQWSEWITLTGKFDNLMALVQQAGRQIARYDKVSLQISGKQSGVTFPDGFDRHGFLTVDMEENHHSVAKLKQALNIEMEA